MKISFIGLGVMGFPMAGHLISKNSSLDILMNLLNLPLIKI